MSFWRRIFAKESRPGPMAGLYGAVVECARNRDWYEKGGVADTMDGRFDMLALVMVLVLRRLDREGEPQRHNAVALTERFIDDMDGQMRQIGIGDFVVGKHIGRMMGALGGRIDAYNTAFDADGDLEAALTRNLYRGERPSDEAVAYVVAESQKLAAQIDAQPLQQLIDGKIA